MSVFMTLVDLLSVISFNFISKFPYLFIFKLRDFSSIVKNKKRIKEDIEELSLFALRAVKLSHYNFKSYFIKTNLDRRSTGNTFWKHGNKKSLNFTEKN